MTSTTTPHTAELTLRQQEIVIAIAEGCSNKEIATTFGITVKTVEFHRNEVKARTGVRGIAGIVRYAIRSGLIKA